MSERKIKISTDFSIEAFILGVFIAIGASITNFDNHPTNEECNKQQVENEVSKLEDD